MKEQHDNEEGYCKMLGHFLTFDYCKTANKGLPCSKVLDCWFQQFNVQEFLKNNYSEDEQKMIFEPPKPKILSLSEILEQAQQRLKKNS
ncbi:MAG: hypothetical protein KAR01_04490 [Desulfocapsa sp.]|nr:hypothetical protein [Desulfocapsa sp.]